ncbi:MAG: ubiquinol-cytochrome c reductase iron-sulfur subunit [Halobacteria archaeon]|nr:ubiquinol-cytochrome c reductase iron-sulfur subunit [Halobacteria archaeon]
MDDNYPNQGRRRFVKSMVGAGVLGSVAAAGYSSVDLLTQKSGVGGGSIKYRGIKIVEGPAPRGMSQIPLKIEGGEIIGRAPSPSGGKGNPTLSIAGFDYSLDWFQYCGVQNYPGVQPEFESDNKFKYSARGWHSDREGDVMKVSDFDDWQSYVGRADNATEGLGKPAWGTWRSEGVEKTIPVAVIKTDKQRLLDNANSDQQRQWIEETCPQGFIGWINKCTHFCCVPQGFQTSDFGCGGGVCAANKVYCQCHQSRYDPFNVVDDTMIALPRPPAEDVL